MKVLPEREGRDYEAKTSRFSNCRCGSAGLSAAVEAKNNGLKDILIVKEILRWGNITAVHHDGFGLIRVKVAGCQYA